MVVFIQISYRKSESNFSYLFVGNRWCDGSTRDDQEDRYRLSLVGLTYIWAVGRLAYYCPSMLVQGGPSDQVVGWVD